MFIEVIACLGILILLGVCGTAIRLYAQSKMIELTPMHLESIKKELKFIDSYLLAAHNRDDDSLKDQFESLDYETREYVIWRALLTFITYEVARYGYYGCKPSDVKYVAAVCFGKESARYKKFVSAESILISANKYIYNQNGSGFVSAYNIADTSLLNKRKGYAKREYYVLADLIIRSSYENDEDENRLERNILLNEEYL